MIRKKLLTYNSFVSQEGIHPTEQSVLLHIHTKKLLCVSNILSKSSKILQNSNIILMWGLSGGMKRYQGVYKISRVRKVSSV